MHKYPLDAQAIEEASRDIVATDKAQRAYIGALLTLLQSAMNEMGMEDTDWYEDAEKLVEEIGKRKSDYDLHRFNQQNGYGVGKKSPYPDGIDLPAGPIDLKTEAQLNSHEATFGDEMSENDLANIFNEKPTRKKKEKKLSKMTLEEIESWEKAQDNSNDIYKVSARIKNLARGGGASLTVVGESLCNTFTHVAKAFYDFAETIQDKETKIKLVELIRSNETMPANFIAAIHVGVKV